MRIAVISDVHANEQALDAALAAVDDMKPDEVWCLGDTVGYGPSPNRCCELVAERADLCLVGNHDLVVAGSLSIDDFNYDARDAALWTRDVLTAENRAWLASLQPTALREGAALFHGSARDPVWEYVLSAETAWWTFRATDEPLVLVGHSHVALEINDDLAGGLARDGNVVDLDGGRWLLNPGSVGQPRDGDPRAAWLELDLDGGSARFHRVEYDIPGTQRQMREVGLPEALAARLTGGV